MPALVATSVEPLLDDDEDADVSEAAAAEVAEDMAVSVGEEDVLDVDEMGDCTAKGPLGTVMLAPSEVMLIALGSVEVRAGGSFTLWLIPCALSLADGERVVRSPPIQSEEVKVV